MIIGIDIDDTITKTFEFSYPLSLEYTRKVCNREPKKIEDISVRTHRYLTAVNEWTLDEEIGFFEENYYKIITSVDVKESAKEIIKKLKGEGHKIVLITARIKTDKFDIYEATIKWLDENEIKYDELIVDAVEKGEVAKNANLDIFIDDSFYNCEEVAKRGIKTYIIDTFANKGLESENITRAQNWNEIYEKINSK